MLNFSQIMKIGWKKDVEGENLGGNWGNWVKLGEVEGKLRKVEGKLRGSWGMI
jgi:hypothetical protein